MGDIFKLSSEQDKRAKQVFKMIDANKSGVLDLDEITVLFETEEEAFEIKMQIDTDGSGEVSLSEWLRFLRNHKRLTYDESKLENPQDEAGAVDACNAEVQGLLDKMAGGAQSDAAKRLRSVNRRRDIEMNAELKMLDNPLGGLDLQPSPAVRKARAEHFIAEHHITDTRFTPEKKLVYHPCAQKEYSERSTDLYGSVGNWRQLSTKSMADTVAEDIVTETTIAKSEVDRTDFRNAAHVVYNDTTKMLSERVKDSINANKKIEKALQSTEGHVRALEEAREAVTTMFELDAEALEEVKFCKERRAGRPVAERVRDEASLSLKRRTEELDIESHEQMLTKIDKTQKALWRAREFLSQHLGSKVVAADIDQQAASMMPDTDPAPPPEEEDVEEDYRDPTKQDPNNVWKQPTPKCKMPKSTKGMFALFQKYAKAYPLRGTGLPSAATFAEILENNSYIDQTEYARFVADYGYNQMLDQDQIAEIFQHNARKEDGDAGSLHFEEFCLVTKEVIKMHEQEKEAWSNEKPEPMPFRSARKTALTMQQVVLESHLKAQVAKPVHLHDKVYIPVHQPVMWKKEVRELCDSVKGHQAEADRVSKKAKFFVDKRRYEDEQGRKRILGALYKKQNATADLIAKLMNQKEVASNDHAKDMAEKEEVENRIAAVEDYLSVAVARLQQRTKRPDSERGRDPAEWALDEEVRELRWELHQLATTHKKLETNIDRLEKLILELDRDITDKSTALDIDQACVDKVQARLMERGKGKNAEEISNDGDFED